MNKLELLNIISTFTIEELLKFINNYEMTKEEYTSHFSNLLDGQITGIYPEGIGIKVSNGEIILTIIQPEGKPKMRATDFANGFQNKNDLIGKICN